MTKFCFLTGPHSAWNRDNDEYPQWYISVAEDLDAEPDSHYKVNDYQKALRLAIQICDDRNIDLENNCTPV